MGENPLDDDGAIDRGNQLHPPGAARTDKLRPKPVAARLNPAEVFVLMAAKLQKPAAAGTAAG